jgi:hypothetical protein
VKLSQYSKIGRNSRRTASGRCTGRDDESEVCHCRAIPSILDTPTVPASGSPTVHVMIGIRYLIGSRKWARLRPMPRKFLTRPSTALSRTPTPQSVSARRQPRAATKQQH